MSDSVLVVMDSAEKSKNIDENIGQLVCNRYRLDKKIGRGTYGVVYSAINTENNKWVAVKVSPFATSKQLHAEYKLYKRIINPTPGEGFPNCIHFGKFGTGQVALVMEHLGPSLAHLMDYCSGKFSLETVVLLACQMIKRVEFLHVNNIIHRDLKPANFVMGLGRNSTTCYIIDFGASCCIRDPMTLCHIPFRNNRILYGTDRYASLNGLQENTVSRRDDMETLGIIFIFMAKGSLPWDGVRGSTNKQTKEKLSELKLRTSIEELCQGLPEEFVWYLQYCKKLKFEEAPNHSYLRSIFQSLARKIHGSSDHTYDWIKNQNKRQLESGTDPNTAKKGKHEHLDSGSSKFEDPSRRNLEH